MKKVFILFGLFVSISTLYGEQGDFANCTTSADTHYEDGAQKVSNDHTQKVNSLLSEKDEMMRTTFTLSKFRTSLIKLQEIRLLYKQKVSEAETEYKEGLLKLKEAHREEVEMCTHEKVHLESKTSL